MSIPSAVTAVFHRSLRSTLPVAVRGEGIYIIDSEGKRYMDASGGAAVSSLGHDDADVRAAIKDQIDRFAFVHSAFFTSEVTEALAAELIERAPGDLGHAYFVSDGSDAVETAIKMSRQYFVEIGEPRRRHVVARQQSYHGNTLGALGVSGNPGRTELFRPLMMQTRFISPCYAYRGMKDGEDAETYGLRVADELEAAILDLGPDTVCAFIAETVVGATLGAVPPVRGYFKRVREVCDKYGVLLILDEVMSGMGRTGTLYACEQEGIAPDLLCLAKGLAAGYQPIGAVLVSDGVYTAFEAGSGAFRHGHTYIGHATACAAALAVQRAIHERGLLAQVRTRGAALRALFESAFADHPHVGDVRGRGLFWGIELVVDRSTKAPFDPRLGLNGRIKTEAMSRGLICYPNGGTADGVSGDHVLVAPPFIVSETELATLVGLLTESIDASLSGVFDAN
jgi:adenosylmethionine-8-amino-7-oxononanoate aminotransferase